MLLRLTSEMSHDGSGRAACFMTIWILQLHFGNSIVSTRRDRSRRWLWRLVRPFHFESVGLLPHWPLETPEPKIINGSHRGVSGFITKSDFLLCMRNDRNRHTRRIEILLEVTEIAS